MEWCKKFQKFLPISMRRETAEVNPMIMINQVCIRINNGKDFGIIFVHYFETNSKEWELITFTF